MTDFFKGFPLDGILDVLPPILVVGFVGGVFVREFWRLKRAGGSIRRTLFPPRRVPDHGPNFNAFDSSRPNSFNHSTSDLNVPTVASFSPGPSVVPSPSVDHWTPHYGGVTSAGHSYAFGVNTSGLGMMGGGFDTTGRGYGSSNDL